MLQEEGQVRGPVDVESPAEDEGTSALDPNNKTCYAPVVAKVQPVLEKVQPVVDRVRPVAEKTAEKISEFFEDDENEVMTEETVTGETQEKTFFRLTPTSFGASFVGLVVGSFLAGPLLGLAIAGGAGYATTRQDRVGEISKKLGRKTYNGLRKGYLCSKEFIESKIPDSMKESSDNAPAEPAAPALEMATSRDTA